MPSAKPVRTEDDLMTELRDAGLTWDALQQAALRIPRDQVGTLESADVIIGGPWPTPLFGSMRYRCMSCNGFVSLAPSSQQALAARPIRVVCLGCAKRECAHA